MDLLSWMGLAITALVFALMATADKVLAYKQENRDLSRDLFEAHEMLDAMRRRLFLDAPDSEPLPVIDPSLIPGAQGELPLEG